MAGELGGEGKEEEEVEGIYVRLLIPLFV